MYGPPLLRPRPAAYTCAVVTLTQDTVRYPRTSARHARDAYRHTSNKDSDNLAGRGADIGLEVTTNTIAKKFLSLASYMFRTLHQFNVPSDNVIFLPASPGSKM